MRHLYGIALAVVLSAAVFFGGGWGFHRLHSTVPTPAAPDLPASGGSLLNASGLFFGLGALLGVGLLAGLLIIVPRVSPLATGLPGLGLLAWTALYVVGVTKAVHYIPMRGQAYGAGFEAMGISGILGLAGIVLLMPLFVPSRWKRGLLDEEEYADEALEATSVTTPSRSAGPLSGGKADDSW